MGYYAERLRQRLERMNEKEKRALWNKLAYLNELGPVVTDYKLDFDYTNDMYESCVQCIDTNPYPSSYSAEVDYQLAA